MGSVNFDRAAGFYDATRALPAEAMAGLTAILAAELAGRQPCLEIGVGTGRIALPLREAGIRLAGLDLSAAMLRRLGTNAGDAGPVPLLRADATRLPLAAGSFGAVLAVHVLHLMRDWRVAVDEALRVLRPGGVLVAGLQGARGRQAGGAQAGERAAGTAPWGQALRESLRRHGLVRADVGTRDPNVVAAYLGGRAAARRLDAVPVRRTRTLAEALARIEDQTFSWSWQYTPEQLRAVSSDVRAWAARENIPADRPYPVAADLQWWAFDRPRY